MLIIKVLDLIFLGINLGDLVFKKNYIVVYRLNLRGNNSLKTKLIVYSTQLKCSVVVQYVTPI